MRVEVVHEQEDGPGVGHALEPVQGPVRHLCSAPTTAPGNGVVRELEALEEAEGSLQPGPADHRARAVPIRGQQLGQCREAVGEQARLHQAHAGGAPDVEVRSVGGREEAGEERRVRRQRPRGGGPGTRVDDGLRGEAFEHRRRAAFVAGEVVGTRRVERHEQDRGPIRRGTRLGAAPEGRGDERQDQQRCGRAQHRPEV